MTYQEIEERRKKLGISQAEMCRRAGISQTTIFYGLKQERGPRNTVAKALLDVLQACENQAH